MVGVTTRGEQPGVPKDCVEFAERFQTAVETGDALAADRAINTNAMVEKALQGLSLSQKAKDGFLRGVKKVPLGEQICQASSKGGSYKLLRVRLLRGKLHALFRLLAHHGGVNYHDMELAKDAHGQVEVVDIYTYTLGEWMSETYRRGALPLVVEENNGIIDHLTGGESEYVKNLPKILEMQRQWRAGKFQEALQTWAELPSSVGNDKSQMYLRVIIASKINDTEYQLAMKAFEKNYPKDPCLNLMMIDAFLLRKQYYQLLAEIDRLDANLGGDPYLNVLRVAAFLPRHDYDKARMFAQKALDEEPTLVSPYWTLVTISLATKNFGETARLLALIETKLGVHLKDLTRIPLYAEFVRSPEYTKWMASRAKT
jgi:tetratricopeptide (TPR) repeat protein